MTPQPDDPEYLAAWIHERLAEDPQLAELGVAVRVAAGRIVLVGAVATEERRERVGRAVADLAPGYDVRNDLSVPACLEPTAPERLP